MVRLLRLVIWSADDRLPLIPRRTGQREVGQGKLLEAIGVGDLHTVLDGTEFGGTGTAGLAGSG